MKISNLRKEYDSDKVYLAADVECGFASERKFCFSLPKDMDYAFADDVYDAFMVAALFPCMFYKEDIYIDGNVSHRILFNLKHYVQNCAKAFVPELNYININAKGYGIAQQCEKPFVATGYSGGVDSFATIVDRYVEEIDEEYKIDKLFFFYLGQFGNIHEQKSTERALNRYNYCCKAAKEIGLPLIFLDTNMFDFYQPKWEFDAGLLCRCSAILAMQRGCRKYYMSGDISYKQQLHFSEDMSDDGPILLPMLSSEKCDIILDGEQYTRAEKTELILNYKPAQHFLNVCVNSSGDYVSADNCSVCHKCNRTMFALDSLGKMEEFSNLFDFKIWKKNRYRYICSQRVIYNHNPYANENIDLARENGKRIPCFLEAYIMDIFFRGIAKIKRTLKR